MSTAPSGGCIARGDLLAERVRVAEDAVEQAALVQRADHVGEASRPGALRTTGSCEIP